MIKVEHLSFAYPGNNNRAVDDVNFEIEKGRIFGFLGPSGAGKSTVQNIMTGLLPLQEGKIFYDGEPLRQLGKPFFNRIGVSFEHPNIYEKLTGLENLHYYAGLFSVKERLSPEQVLDMVGLADARHKRASQYSKGMKQRLVFARAIMHRPDILFLDEPLSGLDPTTGQRIKEIIMQEKARGATIFLTTHNMLLADEVCDAVAFINDGKIIAKDSPRNLKLAYGTRSVKVEYRQGERLSTQLLFLDRGDDREQLNGLLAGGHVETMHSQEATLEQIFIKLTGRGLS